MQDNEKNDITNQSNEPIGDNQETKETSMAKDNKKDKKALNILKDMVNKVQKLEQENKTLQNTIAEMKNDQLLQYANLINEKKFFEQTLKDQSEKKTQNIIKDILSILFNIDMAISISVHDASINNGLIMIKKQALNMLQRYHVFEINATEGELYDPKIHESTSQIDGNEQQKNHIAHMISSGYIINADDVKDVHHQKTIVLRTTQVCTFK